MKVGEKTPKEVNILALCLHFFFLIDWRHVAKINLMAEN
jgi:hypothetical protein